MPETSSLSRRDFFKQAVGGGQTDSATAATAAADPALVPRAPAPVPSLAQHVAQRLTYGPKPGDVAAIEFQSPNAWIHEQLRPTSSNTPELMAALAALPLGTLSENTTQLWDRVPQPYAESVRPVNEVAHFTIASMLHSKWQLFEMMVEFWRDHFNVYAYDEPVMCLYPEWDRLLRQHALGNFRAFVEATSKHPCMLYFLDNYLSTNSGPNENFARELLELHTLGAMNYNVPGGYVDEDVYEASRCFTGWTYERNNNSPDRGKFKYIRENHDRFQKVFLGTQIPRDQADLADGLQILDLLCNHQGTARHIVTKLCRRFVSENPPASLINSAANVFYTNRTHPNQIRLTLEHIFASPEFRDPANRQNLFKRPYDWSMSCMRALGIPYIYRTGEDSFDMTYMFRNQGYQLFSWRSPDGPSYDMYDWCSANTMLRRCNFVFQIDAGWWDDDGLVFKSVEIMPSNLKTPREIANWWKNRIFQREVSDTTADSLLQFIARGRNPDLALSDSQINSTVPRLAALCTVSPEFMWR